MSQESTQPPTDAECVNRSQVLDQGMRFLWLPGRREKLAAQSYDLGHDCRHNGNVALAEDNFRRVLLLLQDSPQDGSDKSLKIFSLVAASHNHLGLLGLDSGRPAESQPCFDRAIEIRRDLRRRFPKDRENEVYLGGALCNRAHSVVDFAPAAAIDFYQQSLSILRQPTQTCECSYWDEQRQSWWCEQLEAMGNLLNLSWVSLAPQFIDNAMSGLNSLQPPAQQQPDHGATGDQAPAP